MNGTWNFELSTINAALTRGSLSRRLLAYLLDIAVIAVVVAAFNIAVAILGLATFGIAWMAFAIPGVVIAVVYNALTVASSIQGTLGMRIAGIRLIDARTGTTLPALNAAVHALLFYVAMMSGLLLLLDLGTGLLRSDSRLGHDLIAGAVAVRS